jgi:hypothetical protein
MSSEFAELAVVAAQTVVAAASTDAWGRVKQGFVQLLGRGARQLAQLATQRLDQTRKVLLASPESQMEGSRADLETTWRVRLADMLELHPEAAADLQALVDQARSDLPTEATLTRDHSFAAGRDVVITASGSSVAAGIIHGDPPKPNPTIPGPAAE